MTCKLYREASVLNTLGMRIEKYKIIIIYIVNQIYLLHLHGLHSRVKKEEKKSDTRKEANRVWLLLLHNFQQIVLKIS